MSAPKAPTYELGRIITVADPAVEKETAAKREGFIKAAGLYGHLSAERIRKQAAKEYPLVGRRVLIDTDGDQWRVNAEGKIEFRSADESADESADDYEDRDECWQTVEDTGMGADNVLHPDIILGLADLLRQPTEQMKGGAK